jgi:hypothetical protein
VDASISNLAALLDYHSPPPPARNQRLILLPIDFGFRVLYFRFSRNQHGCINVHPDNFIVHCLTGIIFRLGAHNLDENQSSSSYILKHSIRTASLPMGFSWIYGPGLTVPLQDPARMSWPPTDAWTILAQPNIIRRWKLS